MKVSIVTSSFNQGRFLEEAICSVLEQDYSDIEYVVVDAGSTDGSREIIERYRNRISKAIFEPDDGPADGLNKAFRAATGDIYGCLNADDVLAGTAVSRAIERFQRDPTIDAVYSDGVMIDGNGSPLRKVLCTHWNVVAYAYGACLWFQPGSFYRRESFWRAGAFNVKNRTCWDGELLVDIALSGGQVRYCPGSVAAFRIHDQSITGSGRLREAYRLDEARIRDKIFGTLGIRESRVTGALYVLQRYLTRFQTIFERAKATTRTWSRN
jgi:glycosyltransferase involved in cell wall biosynthesis